MKKYKEWISDNLRYFILGLSVIILLVLVFIGFRLIKNITSEPSAKTGRETEKSGVLVNETQQETETETQTGTEKETKKERQETDNTKGTETAGGTGTVNKKVPETNNQETEELQTEAPVTGTPQTEAPQTETPQTDPPQTEAPQTDPPQTEAYVPPEPVYITINSAAYIRQAPSYEGEILSVLQAGQTVEFLEDAQGWYKVDADGLIGYVGARFF